EPGRHLGERPGRIVDADPEDAGVAVAGEAAGAARGHLEGAAAGQDGADLVADGVDDVGARPAEGLHGHVQVGRRHPADAEPALLGRGAHLRDRVGDLARRGHGEVDRQEEPLLLHQRSSLMIVAIAHQHASRRIMSRGPGKTKVLWRRTLGPATPMWTVPTGFSSVPPPGPAMPETAAAQVAPARARAPSAIASTVSRETAP